LLQIGFAEAAIETEGTNTGFTVTTAVLLFVQPSGEVSV
jgi:hypothetical protein